MFERDYIDIENFVDEYDQRNYDPDEENLYRISEDGEWESGDRDPHYVQSDCDRSEDEDKYYDYE